MVNLKSIFLSSIGLGVLISCGTEPTPIYTLNTSVNGEGQIGYSVGNMEKITISSGEEQFDEGESITLTALSDSGWVFSSWDGKVTSTSNPIIFTMDGDKSFISNFDRKDYPLNITIIGEGTVAEKIYSQPKSTDYQYETIVELIPASSLEWDLWEFSSWSGDINSNQEIIQIPIKGKTNVTAEFKFTGNKLSAVYIYNENNNLIEQISYDTNDLERSRQNFIYDSENNLVEWRQISSDVVFIEIYKYENGNLSEKIWSENGVEKYRYTYQYDSNNNQIQMKTYVDGSSTELATLFYNYDNRNNLIEEYYIYEGNKVGLILYEYDTSSNLSVKTVHNADGSVRLIETFKYDLKNNLIEVRNSNNTIVTSYSYDSFNNLIGELEMNGNNISSEKTFEYDSSNNLVEEVRRACCQNNELVVMYRLVKVYDEKNNMIERIYYQYN